MSDLVTFNWSIEKFSMCLKGMGNSISSSEFFINKKNDLKGILHLFPYGRSNCEFITITLTVLKGSTDFQCNGYFKLSIISNSDAVRNIDQTVDNENILFTKRSNIYEKENAFLPNDILTIQCEIKVLGCNSVSPNTYYCKTNIGFKLHRFEFPIVFDHSDGVNGKDSATDLLKTISFDKQLKDLENIFDIFSKIECVKSTEKVNLFEVNLSIKGKKKYFATINILLKDRKSDCCLAFEEICENSKSLLKVTFTLNDDQLLSLKNNSALIICELKISDGSTISTLVNQKYNNCIFKKTPLRSLQNIYADKEFCDVVLQVGNDTFKANKCVLAAVSPIFRAMFKSDMVESKTDVINITDIEATVIDKLLEVIYTESLEHLQSDLVIKLYIAADKYQILELKENCKTHLLNNPSIENICGILELSQLYDDDSMKKIAYDIIYPQHKKLFSTSTWKQFIGKCPKVAADIMISIFERINI